MKGLTLLCVTMLLTGCATRPIAVKEAMPVPADRIFAQVPTESGAQGHLVVVRDLGHTAGYCPMAFYVDGTLIAHVYRGEVLSLEVPAGEHIFGASPAGKGMCSWADQAAHLRELSLTVKADRTPTIRLGVSWDGVIQISPTAFGGAR